MKKIERKKISISNNNNKDRRKVNLSRRNQNGGNDLARPVIKQLKDVGQKKFINASWVFSVLWSMLFSFCFVLIFLIASFLLFIIFHYCWYLYLLFDLFFFHQQFFNSQGFSLLLSVVTLLLALWLSLLIILFLLTLSLILLLYIL